MNILPINNCESITAASTRTGKQPLRSPFPADQNIYDTRELEEKATCAKIAQVRQEGQRKVTRQILHYNLDAIISLGYRVNSLRGTQFRQWATKRLKDYLVQGYAVNEKRLAQKQQEVRHLKDGIRILSRAIEDRAAGRKNLIHRTYQL